MTFKNKLHHKIISLILSLVLVISVLPFAAFGADDNGFTRCADPSTMHGWTDYFYKGANDFDTANAGGIWTDKTVLTDNSEFKALGIDSISNPAETGFLSVLSAIGSNMTVMGKSDVATDTVMVLDVSGSMTQSAVNSMVSAANTSIKELMDANTNNRVAIVLYGSTSSVFLPLYHYTTGSNGRYIVSNNGNSIGIDNNLRNSSNVKPNIQSRRVDGATYMQQGLYDALTVFQGATIDQINTPRKPVIMLMTDGIPTYAHTNFTAPPDDSNLGTGISRGTEAQDVFATELTAAYVKAKVTEKYGQDHKALFYTLGMGVAALNNTYKECVLDPVNNNTTAITNFWTSYKAAAANDTIRLENSRYVTKLASPELSEKYVDKYFAAATSDELEDIFQQVLKDIALQTTYHPTLVSNGDALHSGYVSFVDKIGRYMNVVAINGLIINNELYTGSHMASALEDGAFGSIDSPTELGNNLIQSIRQRLNIDANTARSLFNSAYQAEQFYYNSETDFSNYFGWYSDKNNKFLGFYSEGSTVPTDAVYINKSYLYLGAEDLETGVHESDMMYATIRIRETIATGEHEINFAIPASLVPTITYSVELDVDGNLENITTNRDTVSPIRLVYETELDKRINKWTAGEVVDDNYTSHVSPGGKNYTLNSDGSINFYNNKWDFDGEEGYGTYNPYSYFNPSYENNRFYYQEDVKLYVLDGKDYQLYDGTTKPSAADGTDYYYGTTVYAKTGENTFEKKTVFEQIRDEVLPALKQNDEDVWYIPAHYIRRAFADHPISKAKNNTGTLGFYASPYSDYSEGLANSTQEGHSSIVGTTLGNNGKIVLEPKTGIKIVKKLADGTTADEDKEFTFEIKSSNGDLGSCDVYKLDADGKEIQENNVVFDAVGEATVKLKAGETIYIGGMSSGDKVSVYEVADTEYILKTLEVNGEADEDGKAEVALGDVDMPEMVFTNGTRQKAALNVIKRITHPYDANYVIPADKKFNIKLTMSLDGVALGNYTFADNSSTNANGEITVSLAHNESKLIEGIPTGTKVVITEDKYAGFTVKYLEDGVEGDGTVTTTTTTTTTTVTVVNDYEPNDITPNNLTLKATKQFDQNDYARKWLAGDEFTFILQKYTDNSWKNVNDTTAIQKIKITANDGYEGTTATIPLNFTNAISGETYSTPGTYYYRIIEESGSIPGVNYDTRAHGFMVEVSDNDLSGALKITNIKASTNSGATVTVENSEANNTYTVTVSFENDYNPADALANIEINKIVNNPTGSPNATHAGFKFEMAEVKGNDPLVWQEIADETSSTGILKFSKTFTQTGTYKYKIREINTKKTAWTYDTEEKEITVVVSDNGAGALSAIAYIGDTAPSNPSSTVIVDFENTYEPKNATVKIDFVSKILKGRNLETDEFNFVVLDKDNKVYTTGTNEAAKDDVAAKVNFLKDFVFDKVGEYNFSVCEVTDNSNITGIQNADIAGISFDYNIYDITVTVTDDGTGTLKAELTVDNGINNDNKITFVNTYKAENIKYSVEAKKNLDGKTLFANNYEFFIQECNENGTVKEGAKPGLAYNAEDKSITFPEVEYTSVGTFYYLVWESVPQGDPLGITYDETKFLVKVVITDDYNEGKLKADISYKKQLKGETAWVDSPNGILFNNIYSAKETSVTFEGYKTLEGMDLVENAYSFNLYESNELWEEKDKLDTKSNGVPDSDKRGYFTFKVQTLDKVGTYYYLVNEVIPTDASAKKGVEYDDTVYRITVTVTDNGRGQLEKAVSIKTNDNVPVDNISFENIYAPVEGTSVVLSGKKTLEKGSGTNVDFGNFTFTFELYNVNENFVTEGTPETVNAVADGQNGKYSFTKNYTPDDLGKTYYYVIKEKNNGVGGMTYSQEAYNVTVELIDDDKDGELESVVTVKNKSNGDVETDKLDFNNKYEIKTGTSFSISGKKELDGRNRKDKEFKFDVYASNEQGVISGNVLKSGYNNTNGDFSITQIPISKAGINYFVLKEDSSSSVAKPGVIYDIAEYLITVNVVDNKDGTLSVAQENGIKYEKIKGTGLGEVDSLVFNNSYKASASAPINIKGEKVLEGRKLKSGEFTFILTETNASFEPVSGKTILTTVNGSDGKFEFGALTYETAGKYYYIVTEDDSDKLPRTKYDDAVYYVIVTVTDNEETGKLVADYVVKTSPSTDSTVDITFKNIFTPKPKDIDVVINIDKIVENIGTATITGAGFEFLLERIEDSKQLTVKTDKDGKAKFVLSFTEEDIGKTYNYTLTEVDDGRENVKYSTAIYDIAITVSLDNDNKLVASFTQNTLSVNNIVAEFVNEYDYTPPTPPEENKTGKSPKTGDIFNPYLWIALLFVSGGGIAVSYKKMKKSQDSFK